MVLANLSMLLDPMANYKEEKIFTVAFLNIRGQSGLPISKQLQIEPSLLVTSYLQLSTFFIIIVSISMAQHLW